MLRHSDASFLFLLHFLGGLVVQLERSNHQLLHGPHARQRPPPSLGAACRDACQRFFRRRRCRGRRGRPSQGRGHVLSFSVPGPTLHQRTPMESGAVEGFQKMCQVCLDLENPNQTKKFRVCLATRTTRVSSPCVLLALFSRLSVLGCPAPPELASPLGMPNSLLRGAIWSCSASLAQMIHQLSFHPAN